MSILCGSEGTYLSQRIHNAQVRVLHDLAQSSVSPCASSTVEETSVIPHERNETELRGTSVQLRYTSVLGENLRGEPS